MIILVAAVFTFGLSTFTVAQMMGGNNGHSAMNKNDTSSHSHMKGTPTDVDSTFANMSQHYKMMTNQFDKLESHFNKMMMMNDITALKAEMQKHQEMMKAMHKAMMKQGNMYEHMMTMMHSGDMMNNNMMGMKSDKSDVSK